MPWIAKKGNPKEIWENVKKDSEVLKEAIQPRKDKFGEKDLLKGTTIAEIMLIDYQKLINTIYSNTDIARLGFGPINSRATFLLMSLWNRDLKLTEEQKAFAVSEAMNKISIVKQNNEDIVFEQQKIDTQTHGSGAFDIRYQILRNPNWTIEEKQKLIMDFWYDDEEYDETLEEWEWDVVNDNANYKGEPLPPFDRYDLFHEYTYDMLLIYYGNKETTDRIWSEIMFCKQMHELRPQQWEKGHKQKEKKFNETH